jgi:hypothetical protein
METVIGEKLEFNDKINNCLRARGKLPVFSNLEP